MSLLKGSASFVEFSVKGELPADSSNFIADRIKAFSFKDIDDSYDEYSVGWVSVLNMFDSEFAYSSHSFGSYVAMSLRVDERKIPGAILKKCVAKEIAKVKAERQVPKLSRSVLVGIKERVKTELIRKAKPTPTVADVLWDIANNRVLLFSTNKSIQAIFEDFFKESLGLNVTPVDPEEITAEALQRNPDTSYTPGNSNIGCEFLTWLWFKSLTGDGLIHLGNETVNVEIGDKIQLESTNPGEKVSCSNSYEEAKKALAVGKIAVQMDLTIDRDDTEIPLTFAASSFSYKGVKLPKTSGTESGEDEGVVLERIYLFLKVLDTVRQMFDAFIALRLSQDWPAGEGAALEQWCFTGEVNETE